MSTTRPVIFALAARATLCLANAGQPQAGRSDVPWVVYKSGQTGGIAAARQLVIQDVATWRLYWRELTGQLSAPEDVDFAREQFVALHLGRRNTGGYDVYVETIRATGPASYTVHYVESKPPSGSATTQAITSPWTIARMPRWAASATFSKRVVEGHPGGGRGETCACCWRCGAERPAALGQSWGGFAGLGGDPFDPLNNITWRTYRTGSDSKIERFQTLVIENEAIWQRYWARHTNAPPQAAPKNVDWLKHRVIAVHLGQAEAGASVAIESVQRKRSSEIEVTYVVTQAGSGSRTGGGTPYAIATVDRVAGTFTFKRRDVKPPPGLRSVKCGCGCAGCKLAG